MQSEQADESEAPVQLSPRTRLFTPAGDPRGYIQPAALRELWFHTGTICNLSCPFCLEGSKPGDDRLNRLTLADAVPFIDEAVALGVAQFSFTGGEPFVVRDVVTILEYALARRPCLVLTNGTEPLVRRMDAVLALRALPHPLAFRVSIDHPAREAHDAGRGEGNFEMALGTAAALHAAGFHVSIARQMQPGEDEAAMLEAYRRMFAGHGLPEDTRVVAFPDFATPGARRDVPQITEDCMTRYQTAETRAKFMCAYSKMVVKRQGRMRVYACTLVDDDPGYELGSTLRESLPARVMLRHHRCYACFKYGASCSES